jgi:hypothetical protein
MNWFAAAIGGKHSIDHFEYTPSIREGGERRPARMDCAGKFVQLPGEFNISNVISQLDMNGGRLFIGIYHAARNDDLEIKEAARPQANAP